MKKVLVVVAVFALMAYASPAQAVNDLGPMTPLNVVAKIDTFVDVYVTYGNWTIDFGADIGDPNATGMHEATDYIQVKVGSNVNLRLDTHCPALTASPSALETEYKSYIYGEVNVADDLTGWSWSGWFGAQDTWTGLPWVPPHHAALEFKQGTSGIEQHVRVDRQGLLDPPGDYTATVTSTLSAR